MTMNRIDNAMDLGYDKWPPLQAGCCVWRESAHLPGRAEVLVIAGVEGVLAALVRAELQREQRVLAPRHVGVHVDLVQGLGQVSEPLTADGTQVHLSHHTDKGLRTLHK